MFKLLGIKISNTVQIFMCTWCSLYLWVTYLYKHTRWLWRTPMHMHDEAHQISHSQSQTHVYTERFYLYTRPEIISYNTHIFSSTDMAG